MKTITFLIIFIGFSVRADLVNPLKADFIDFSKLSLNDYIDKKKKDWIVEKQKSLEDSSKTIVFIFEKKDTEVERRMIIQIFDLNGDNKLDLARHYQNGILVRMEADLDHDGKVDEVSEYDKKTSALIKKTVSSGATNEWRYWFNNELRLKEIDRNNDRKPDMWIHYRNNKVVKQEVDSTFDGKQIKIIE